MKASELFLRLQSDEAYLARQRERQESDRKSEEISRAVEASLITELRQHGVNVKSVWELVNSNSPYRPAIPVLVKHLGMDYPDRTKGGIARSLGHPYARDLAWDFVVDAYLKEPAEPRSWTKEGLAVAISEMAKASDHEQVFELAADRRHGSTRVLFVRVLARSRAKGAISIAKLRDDPDLQAEISAVETRRARRSTPKL